MARAKSEKPTVFEIHTSLLRSLSRSAGLWPGPSGGEAEELYRSRSLSAFQVRFRSVNSSCKQRKVSKQEVDGQMSH